MAFDISYFSSKRLIACRKFPQTTWTKKFLAIDNKLTNDLAFQVISSKAELLRACGAHFPFVLLTRCCTDPIRKVS